MSIEVNFSQDDETKAAAFAHIYQRINARTKKNVPHQILVFILVVSGWIFIAALHEVSEVPGVTEKLRWLIGSLVCFVFAAIGVVLSAKRVAKNSVLRNRLSQQTDLINLRADDTGISMSWQNGTSSFNWAVVTALDQDQTYFFLVTLMENCIAIRKSDLTPLSDIPKFSAYFESRIPA